MKESTEEKTSLADDIGEAYDELSGAEVEETVEAADEESADTVIVIEADDDAEAGDVEQAEEEPAEESNEEPVAAAGKEEPTEEQDDVEPLAHWYRKDKEMFKKLPREAKEFLIARDKEWQRQANEKVQESLAMRRALEPLREELTQYGISDDQAVRTLVGAHQMLKSDPKRGILHLMNQYKLSPEALFSQEEAPQPQVDPEFEMIKNKVLSYEQMMTSNQQAALAARLDEFSKSAEFYEDVIPEMTQLAWAERQRNPNVVPDIQVLYDRACWLNEGVRAKLLKRQSGEVSKAESTQRSKAAAGTKVRPTAAAKRRPDEAKPKSTRDTLAAVWDEVEQRETRGTAL